jgi:hypothetical protein
MDELIKSKHNMLNPVLTKFLQVNTILYSKSLSAFSPLGSIDPNAGLAHKIINDPNNRKSGVSKLEAIQKAQQELPE